jgi:hypothetical protein
LVLAIHISDDYLSRSNKMMTSHRYIKWLFSSLQTAYYSLLTSESQD